MLSADLNFSLLVLKAFFTDFLRVSARFLLPASLRRLHFDHVQQARDKISARGVQTVLAALDCSSSGEEVLKTAIHLAKAIGAKVRLVHANDLGVDVSAPAQDCEEMFKGHSAHAKAALARMLAELREEGIEVETALIDGIPADVILKQAEDADLIVMGRHWRPKWRIFSRNTVEAVVSAAPCPVVIAGGSKSDQQRAKSGWRKQTEAT